MTLVKVLTQRTFDVNISTVRGKKVSTITDRDTGREIGQVLNYTENSFWTSSEFLRSEEYQSEEEAIAAIKMMYSAWLMQPIKFVEDEEKIYLKHCGKKIGKYWALGDTWISERKCADGRELKGFGSDREAIAYLTEAHLCGWN